MWSPLVKIPTQCPVCYDQKVIVMQKAKHDAWRAGAFIQDVLPQLPREDRERLISGTCPSCFDKMFAIDEERNDA